MNIKETGKCCLCGGEYEHDGCNPKPVCTIPDARCCDKCHFERVMPARGANYGMTYEEYLAWYEASRKADEQPTEVAVEVSAEENYGWDEFDDEPYVCVPLALWQNILTDNLEKIRTGLFTDHGEIADVGEIAALRAQLSGLIGFCNHCEAEHTY